MTLQIAKIDRNDEMDDLADTALDAGFKLQRAGLYNAANPNAYNAVMTLLQWPALLGF